MPLGNSPQPKYAPNYDECYSDIPEFDEDSWSGILDDDYCLFDPIHHVVYDKESDDWRYIKYA